MYWVDGNKKKGQKGEDLGDARARRDFEGRESHAVLPVKRNPPSFFFSFYYRWDGKHIKTRNQSTRWSKSGWKKKTGEGSEFVFVG